MDLKKYLFTKELKITDLATCACISYPTALKAYHSKTIDLESASKIVCATEGIVTYEDLLSSEVMEDLQRVKSMNSYSRQRSLRRERGNCPRCGSNQCGDKHYSKSA